MRGLPDRGEHAPVRVAPTPAASRRWIVPAAAILLSSACGGATSVADPALAAPAGAPASEPAPIDAGVGAPEGWYDRPVDVLHYDIEIAVSDTAGWIRGRTVIDLRLTGALDGPLALDFTGLAVDRVEVGGAPVPVRHVEGHLHVPLPPDAGVVRVDVRYRGVPDDGLILGENVHGKPSAFVDNWPNRARFWFPSVDHPSDKATVDFTIHAPAEWVVVANGVRPVPPAPTEPATPGPATSGGRLTWRWSHGVPVSTYNMVFGGAEMAVEEVGVAACGRAPASPRPDGCVSVSTWLFPESIEAAAPSFRRAPRMVDLFTGLFGPFPYGKLANVQSSTRFGGMENASAIFYSERALASGRNVEGTVSHEIVHQWFGDSATEADWSHLWLSEGFATYFGAHFFEVADGVEAFRARMERARESVVGSDASEGPVIDPDQDDLFALLNTNNYQKGAWVLHMLRGLVGDEAFFAGVREYYRRHRESTALTEDFRAAMEETAGQELGWFFEQWLHRPGYPVLDVVLEDPSRDGGSALVVRQLQDEAWPTFRFPLEVELRRGGEVERIEILVDEREERIALPDGLLDGPPDAVLPDPDGWLLKEISTAPEGGAR